MNAGAQLDRANRSTAMMERNPDQESPPSSLPSDTHMCHETEKEKPTVAPQPAAKPKLKSSLLIEKLQANLTLTPTALLPSVKSPEVKQHPLPFCLISPSGPLSPTLRPPQQLGADEVPVSFEQPAEGNLLPCFNKSRIRLPFNRRPPTRWHRKSSGEEVSADTHVDNTSPCDQCSPENSSNKNGDAQEVLSSPLQEEEKQLEDSTHKVSEPDFTDQQGHKDLSQDTEGSKNSNGEDVGELAEEQLSDRSEASEAGEIQQEEKQHEEQSSEEEQGESTPIEENDKIQVQASED